MSTPRLVLVLGGTRSGKSEVAERLVADAGASEGRSAGPGAPAVVYLATAPTGAAGDSTRTAAHRARRPASWRTVELDGALDLVTALHDAGEGPVLLDGLGAWLAGALNDAGLLDDDGARTDPADGIDGAAAIAAVGQAVQALAAAALERSATTVVVGEESGLAPVAGDRGTRRWVDLLGTAHQTLAARADRVLFVVAGRVVELSPLAAGSSPADGTVVAAAPSAGSGSASTAPTTEPADAGSEPPPPGDEPTGLGPPADVIPASVADTTTPADRPRGGQGTALPATDYTLLPADLRRHGDRMVAPGDLDFAVNVVQGDPPGWAMKPLRDGLERVARYPDDRAAAAALAARHGRTPPAVLPLGGAVEGFWRVALALRPRRAAVVVPGFTEAEAALRAVGAQIVHVPRDPRDDWALDPEAVPEDCDLVAIGRPDNPTGVVDPRESVLRLRRPGRTVLVDEAFGDFLGPDGDALADHRTGDDGPGALVVLRSLTKILSVPGTRCGYLLGDPELVALLRDAGPPWTCPTPSLDLLEAYAERPDGCQRIAARTEAHRRDLVARLRQLAGVQVWDGAANFVLVRAPSGIDVAAGLHHRGIAVRPCRTFQTLDDSYARVAVRSPALHAQLATALAATISDAEGAA